MSSNSVPVNGWEMVRAVSEKYWIFEGRLVLPYNFPFRNELPLIFYLILNSLSKLIPFLDLFHFKYSPFQMYSLFIFIPITSLPFPNLFPFQVFPFQIYSPFQMYSFSKCIPLSKFIPFYKFSLPNFVSVI